MSIRLATIGVAGLKTQARFVDRLICECYLDSQLTQLFGTQTSAVQWDGVFNNQSDYMAFAGLEFGREYWFRAGVVAPITGDVTWHIPYAMIAGGSGAPDCTFTGTFTATVSGVTYDVVPQSVPSDINHFEAFWTKDGSTPANNARAMWSGSLHNGGFAFFAGAVPGQTVTCFLRGVNTSHVAQGWQEITPVIVTKSTQFGSIDDIPNGTLYGKVSIQALDNNGFIDPRGRGFIPIGNVGPFWFSDQIACQAGADGPNPGQGWINFWWNQIVLYRADNNTNIIGSVPFPGWRIAGLNPGQNYWWYFYVDTLNRIGTIGGGVGIGVQGVWPLSAQVAPLPYLAQQQGYQANMPITNGGIMLTIPIYVDPGGGGTYTGSTGGFGGSGCVRADMKVRERRRGIIDAAHVRAGDYLLTDPRMNNGSEWVKVLNNVPKLTGTMIDINIKGGDGVVQDPGTPMHLIDADDKYTHQLNLGDLLYRTNERAAQITSISLLEETCVKSAITCDYPHTFFAGKFAPEILTHNTRMVKS